MEHSFLSWSQQFSRAQKGITLVSMVMKGYIEKGHFNVLLKRELS